MAPFAGHISLRAEARESGRTVLAHQSFRAPFHLSKPYWDNCALIVQIVNPTAGILSGDSLTAEIDVAENAALLVTSPSATRVFQMDEGSAICRHNLRIGKKGWLEFWPEPLILHQKSRYTQSTQIEADGEADFFYGDFLLPGRIARGEAWSWSALCLELQVKIAGELVLRERLNQSGEELKRLANWARAGEGAAFGNVVIGSPRLQEMDTWREQIISLDNDIVSIGVSRLRGAAPAYSIKFIAVDGEGLRRTLGQIRKILTPFFPRLACDPRKL